jgi:hypothetical protein
MPVDLLVGVAVGAAAASSSVRKAVRKSMIYGLGGLLVAYDKVTAVAHGAVQGARGQTANGPAPAGQASAPTDNNAQAPAPTS